MGAVSFTHRFGSTLNPHYHFHCLVLDGLFMRGDGRQVDFVQAVDLAPDAIAAMQERVRRRVVRACARHGVLDEDEVEAMLAWEEGGGFSLDAQVRIEATDRGGLERLVRYCARSPLALERLSWEGEESLTYRLTKPTVGGRRQLSLAPLELLEKLAALIPPPRVHRHRYHGVLAPNAALRAEVTAMAARPVDGQTAAAPSTPAPVEATAVEAPAGEGETKRAPSRYLWAMLLARIYEVFPLLCPNCGAELRLIAFVTDSARVAQILEAIGEPSRPPRVAPARAPPWWAEETAACAEDDFGAQPSPDYVFDQTVSW